MNIWSGTLEQSLVNRMFLGRSKPEVEVDSTFPLCFPPSKCLTISSFFKSNVVSRFASPPNFWNMPQNKWQLNFQSTCKVLCIPVIKIPMPLFQNAYATFFSFGKQCANSPFKRSSVWVTHCFLPFLRTLTYIVFKNVTLPCLQGFKQFSKNKTKAYNKINSKCTNLTSSSTISLFFTRASHSRKSNINHLFPPENLSLLEVNWRTVPTKIYSVKIKGWHTKKIQNNYILLFQSFHTVL